MDFYRRFANLIDLSCSVDYAIFIIWMSPFPILGMSGVFFIFILFLIEIPVCKQGRP